MKPKVKAFYRTWGDRIECGVEVTNGLGERKQIWSQTRGPDGYKAVAAMADSDAMTIAMALEHCGIPCDFETTCL